MTEEEFRQKYPHSTDEQVRLYCEAVALEMAGVRPVVEPDIPMPIVTVPERVVPAQVVTTYAVPNGGYILQNFSLADVPPEMPSRATSEAMRDILLGPFNAHLSPDQRQLFESQQMSADDMLSMFFDPKQPTQSVGPN